MLNEHFSILFPWLILSAAIAVALYAPFSYWAINSDFFGKFNMGKAIFFSFSFPISIYISAGISLVSLLMSISYRKINIKGCRILLFSSMTGAVPLAFILFLDF